MHSAGRGAGAIPKIWSKIYVVLQTKFYFEAHLRVWKFIGASLSEPHYVRSTVKSVFLLACLFDTLPYMAKNLFKCKPTLHQVHGVLTTLHQTRGVLTIT